MSTPSRPQESDLSAIHGCTLTESNDFCIHTECRPAQRLIAWFR